MLPIPYSTITERVQESAFLLKFKTLGIGVLEKKEEVFFYQDGIASFIDYVTIDQQPVGNPIILRGTNNKIETRVALQYTGDYQENIFSYVNLVRTKDGGTHEIGLRTAITRSFNEFARKYNVLKEKDKNFDGVDIREGLTAIIALNPRELTTI